MAVSKENEHKDLEAIDDEFGMEVDLEDVETHSTHKIKELKRKLKECEQEKMTHLEELQRTKADFLNSKRRLENERSIDRDRATVEHVQKLLPLYDSFMMAMNNKEVWDRVDADWRTGIESIKNQLNTVLQSYNIYPIEPVGEVFDPTVHEAIGSAPVATEEEHDHICTVVQPGFVRRVSETEELVRPARVIVGEYSSS